MMNRKCRRRAGAIETKAGPHCGGRMSLCAMRRATYAIAGWGTVHGCLWRVEGGKEDEGRGYAVSLVGLGFGGFCLLGTNQRRAQRIFGQLVENTVTPCAMQDVLEEIIQPANVYFFNIAENLPENT